MQISQEQYADNWEGIFGKCVGCNKPKGDEKFELLNGKKACPDCVAEQKYFGFMYD